MLRLYVRYFAAWDFPQPLKADSVAILTFPAFCPHATAERDRSEPYRAILIRAST